MPRRLVCRFVAALLIWAGGLTPSVAAQGVVSGLVTDGATGLPLPGATVQVDGRPVGAITNSDGRFTLAIVSLPARLTARFIGYRSESVVLDRLPREAVEIRMQPEIIELEELVVSGEDPAYPIVRRALAAKRAWRDTVQTAYAEGYSRFTLMREFQPVRMEESISAWWWTAASGPREVVRARRTRPARDEDFRFAAPIPIPNFYDDDVVLDGAKFVGPLHPEAPERYDLKLVGRRSRDGRTVFDVAFIPAGPGATGFVGLMAIEDSTFDLLYVSARPAADQVGPPPVLARRLQIEQSFVRVGGAVLPVSFAAQGEVNFGAPGAAYPTARYRQVSGLSLHATRVPVPDSLVESTELRRFAPGLDQQAWLFDWNPGMVPMTDEEIAELSRLSSAPRLARAFLPEGLLRQYLAVPVVVPKPVDPTDRPVELMRPWVWYNRVDGWQAGVQPRIPVLTHWTVSPKIGYAIAREGVPWAFEVIREPARGLRVGVGADQFSAITGEVVGRDRLQLGLAAYAGLDDYYDYFERTRAWSRVGWAFADVPVRFDLIASAERHRSAIKNDEYTGLILRNEQRENPPISEGGLTSIAFELARGDQRLPGSRFAAYAGSRIEFAQSGWRGSDFDYVRWSGAVAVRIPTLLRRRADPAALRIDVFAGLGTEGIPIQREGFLDSAVGVLAPGAGFRVPRGRMPLSKQWLAVFWQHDFGPAIGEWLGLGERAERWGIFGGHGQAWGDPIGWRHEAGIFVRNVWRLPLRINVASPTGFWAPHVTVLLEPIRRKPRG